MKCDVLVKWDDSIQRSLAEERDESSTDREEDTSDVEVEAEGCRPSNRIAISEGGSSFGEVVFEGVIHEAKGVDHAMHGDEEKDKETS